MLDILKELIRAHSREAIVNNPAVPDEKNDAVIDETAHSLSDTISKILSSGDLSSLLKLGGPQVGGMPATQDAALDIKNRLCNKLGISPEVATSIASVVLPLVMKAFASRLSNPQDTTVTPQNLLGLMGEQTQSNPLAAMLGKFSGQNSINAESMLQEFQSFFSGSGSLSKST